MKRAAIRTSDEDGGPRELDSGIVADELAESPRLQAGDEENQALDEVEEKSPKKMPWNRVAELISRGPFQLA